LQQAGMAAVHRLLHLLIEGIGGGLLLALHRHGHGAELDRELDDVHRRESEASPHSGESHRPPASTRCFYSFPDQGRRSGPVRPPPPAGCPYSARVTLHDAFS
ncbi:MAG: hypothetical protein ACK56F_17995, partial [bacterium]